MQNEKFDARSGCLDFGNSYEFLMAAYYGLRLNLNETVADFKISINNKDMGNFDDVVLEITYSDGDECLYALQLKHRVAKADNITVEAFSADKGKFGLTKYAHGFEETEKICRDNPAYNIPFEKFHFVLYTNQVLARFHTYDKKNHKKVEADELELKSEVTIYKYDKCVARGLLDLSGSEDFFIFKFRNREERNFDEKFLDQFVLYTKQQDAQEMERRISSLINHLFPNCDSNVVVNYINFFKCWWRGDFGKLKLSKKDIMCKLAEYVLTSHIPEVKFRTLPKGNFDSVSRAFANFDLIVVPDCENLEEDVWGVILKNHFTDVDFRQWSQPFSEKKFFPEGTTIPISAQGENFVEQSLKKIYLILWHMDKLPLFIKVYDRYRKAIYSAVKLCEQNEPKKKFILMDGNFENGEFSSDLKIFQKLSDLKESNVYEEICDTLKISLQGRPTICLSELLQTDNSFRDVISVKEILEMLDKNFIIGQNCINLPKHYISRLIPRILLNWSTFDGVQNDIFVISLQGTQLNIKGKIDLNKYLLVKSSDTAQLLDRVICVHDLCTYQQFQQVCALNTNKNCHHVKVIDKNTIEWVETHGSINSLRPFQLNSSKFVEDSNLVNYFTSKINVICAPPGMGKSVILNYLNYKCSPDRWVIFINLNEHIKFFKEDHKEVNDILTYFSKTNDAFLGQIFNVFSSRRRLLFLWDAFDELPTSSIAPVVSAIKMLSQEGYCNWISARTDSRDFLETTFGVFSLSVAPFDEKNQQDYIYTHLKEKYSDEEKLHQMMSKLNENMSSSLSCGHFDYTGVPLHIYMVLEIFLKNPEKYLEEFQIATLTDIYEGFIDGKFTNLYERANANKNNYLMQKIQKKYKETQLLQYEVAALKASFDEEIFKTLKVDCVNFLQKIVDGRDNLGLILGVNDDGKPVFTHKTYEEFLTASWLVKNHHRFVDPSRVVFHNTNVRLMFDLILAKDSPTHIAVLYRNLAVLKNEDVTKSYDKGGRNALQVACSWGMRHPCVSVCDKTISVAEVPDSCTNNVEIVKFLVKQGCDPLEKDQLFQWNAVEYSDRTLSLAMLELFLSLKFEIKLEELSNFNDTYTVLYYSIKFGYHYLFYQLKTYPYLELKIGENEIRTLLQFAVQMNRIDCVTTLLSFPHYRDVINRPYKDLTGPLFSAISNENMEMFRLLQASGALMGRNQLSLLIAAIAFANIEFCQKLLSEDGADPNVCNIDGNSVLQVAAFRNRLDIMELLIKFGADVNFVNYYDLTALDYCIDQRSLKGVQLLVKHGAKVNRQGKNLYGYTSLHNACELNEEEIVKFLLLSGADPAIKSNQLYTPLHVALINRLENIARILLEANSNVINEYSEERTTPVMLAALNNFSSLIKRMAELGADMDSVGSKDSPLRIATLKKFEGTVEVLIKNGADVNRPDVHGFTPLFYAITNEKILKLFLDHNATNVNAQNLRLVTPLHFAAENGKLRAVEELLKHGASPDAQDCLKYTPLHYAIKMKHDDILKSLLKSKPNMDDGFGLLSYACINDVPDCLLTLLSAGITINSKDKQGRTLLHFAATTSLVCTKILLMMGCDTNACDTFGLSPLCYSVFMGKLDIITEFVKKGGDFTKGFASSTALHVSSGLGDVATSVLLIRNGCNVNAQDENGRTPLHCVSQQNCGSFVYEMIKLLTDFNIPLPESPNYECCALVLLESGGDITIQDNSKWTPLISCTIANNFNMMRFFIQKVQVSREWQNCFYVAASKNFIAILQVLLENGTVEIDCREETKGLTALHFACANGCYDTVVFLINHGADVNFATVDGCVPLHFSTNRNDLNLVKLLVENNVQVDFSNVHGNTGLFIAAAQGFLDIVVFLHKHGADINVIDADGDSPLHDAAKNGHTETVRYLVENKAVICKNKDGKLPVDLARDNQKTDIIEILE